MATADLVQMTPLPIPPGPRGSFFFGSLFDVWSDPLKLMTEGVQAHGDIVMFRFAYVRYAVLADPDAIKHVLVQNHRNYTKSVNYRGLKMVLGNGLLTSEGEEWRKQRRMAQPAFHRERLAGFAAQMAECTSGMLDRWKGV